MLREGKLSSDNTIISRCNGDSKESINSKYNGTLNYDTFASNGIYVEPTKAENLSGGDNIQKHEHDVAAVVLHLEESRVECKKSHRNENKFKKAKEQLTNEARQFVTASKLFVKSATESESEFGKCLNHCVQLLQHIGMFYF